jgi:hypothetical protein
LKMDFEKESALHWSCAPSHLAILD